MVDATTGTTTGAVYETIGNLPSDVGAWVALDQRRVSLGPGQSAIVGFTLTVPAGARRGEHLGGIVAAPAEGPAAQGGESSKRSFHVNVVNQSVLAVQVNLPGAARSLLRVRGVKAGDGAGYQTLLLTLSNPGERMVRGSGTVRIADASGNVVGRQRFIIDAFLPRTRIDYPMVVRGRALLPGAYRATVTLDWGAGKRTAPFRFEVTRKNIKQAFGSKGLAQLPGESASSNGGGGLGGPILAGVLALLLGIGGSMLYFRRHTRRLEERLMARNAETGNEARSS
jgi:hypothetical protein